MTLLTLSDDQRLTGDDEPTLLLGVEYDAPADRRPEDAGETVVERQRYDEQILAGLVWPW